MPFPLDEKFILQTETELEVSFPKGFRQKMMQENGGEINTPYDYFELFPFYDTSDRKRIKRTAVSNIEKETTSAKSWPGFPTNAITIGSNGSGDLLIFLEKENKQLGNEVYVWDHETRQLILVAHDFGELIENKV